MRIDLFLAFRSRIVYSEKRMSKKDIVFRIACALTHSPLIERVLQTTVSAVVSRRLENRLQIARFFCWSPVDTFRFRSFSVFLTFVFFVLWFVFARPPVNKCSFKIHLKWLRLCVAFCVQMYHVVERISSGLACLAFFSCSFWREVEWCVCVRVCKRIKCWIVSISLCLSPLRKQENSKTEKRMKRNIRRSIFRPVMARVFQFFTFVVRRNGRCRAIRKMSYTFQIGFLSTSFFNSI